MWGTWLVVALLAGLLVGGGVPHSARAQPNWRDPWALLDWRLDGQAYAYGQGLERTADSLLNPGNAYAHQPNFALDDEIRPNLRGSSEYLDVLFQPRLTARFETGAIGGQRGDVRTYIQQGLVRLKPGNDITVTAGRELLTWGPAFFRSPSNPYYFNNARLNPIVELSGIDLARVTYNPSSTVAITTGGVFDSGHGLISDNAYAGSLLIKADLSSGSTLGSLVVSSFRGRQTFVGGYAQETVGDAVLLYQEAGSSSDAHALALSGSGDSAFYRETKGPRSATALIGASYTFESGNAFYSEYLFNGYGYSRSNLRHYFTQADAARAQGRLASMQSAAGLEGTGQAARRANSLLSRHYLYLQYQNNPSTGDTIWRVMGTQNLEDYSTQVGAYLEHNLGGRITLFALGTYNIGPRDTEFGALLRASLIAGLKIYMF